MCLLSNVEYSKDLYWVCGGLESIRRVGPVSVMDCRVF